VVHKPNERNGWRQKDNEARKPKKEEEANEVLSAQKRVGVATPETTD
jgi:hypothetical protein